MKTEDRLKAYILQNYRTIREFVATLDMPYTTVDTILKRGIEKASVSNLSRICDALNIDINKLVSDGIITPKTKIGIDSLTGEESKIIENYRQLDEHGKEMIEMMLVIELRRTKDRQ